MSQVPSLVLAKKQTSYVSEWDLTLRLQNFCYRRDLASMKEAGVNAFVNALFF